MIFQPKIFTFIRIMPVAAIILALGTPYVSFAANDSLSNEVSKTVTSTEATAKSAKDALKANVDSVNTPTNQTPVASSQLNVINQPVQPTQPTSQAVVKNNAPVSLGTNQLAPSPVVSKVLPNAVSNILTTGQSI